MNTLTVEQILEKEFKSGMNGYKKDDVDAFLDAVIKDYEEFNMEVGRLFQENENLRKQVKELNRAIQLKHQDTQQKMVGNPTNFDIIKRISNLEKAVFGSMIHRE